jgi:hypothetical protein
VAKRKLSPQQRETIRKEIRQLISQKKIQAEILKAMASKYHVSPITARWYYMSVAKPGKGSPRVKAQTPRRGRPVGRKTRIKPSIGAGLGLRIVHQVQSIAEKSFKRVVEAKKLIPKWQIYVKKEASLRKLEEKVKSQLRVVSSKAIALHRKIRGLTSN